MKKIIFICISLGVLFVFTEVRARVIVYDYFVDVSSTGIIASNKLTNRKYYYIVNMSSSFVVYHSTASINAGNYVAKGALPIPINYGFWEDAYFVYKSTWYITIATTGTATVAIREKE